METNPDVLSLKGEYFQFSQGILLHTYVLFGTVEIPANIRNIIQAMELN